MSTLLRTRIIKIGNSQGVRIPKTLLELARLGDEVEMEVSGDQIVLRPAVQARQGWDAHFARMASQAGDGLLDDDSTSLTSWDEEDWVWE